MVVRPTQAKGHVVHIRMSMCMCMHEEFPNISVVAAIQKRKSSKVLVKA